ncbi:MAG: tyrosine recombinase XerC [Ruminococcaceae bacterium]|nr:tyrosine recombinase XerC [Oscillospiraceae bacterium]
MDNIPEILNKYIFYKRTVQNRSEKTVEQYLIDLTLFFRFLIAKRDGISTKDEAFSKIDIRCVDLHFMEQVRLEDIYEFFNYIATERDNHARARARKLSSIRSFYKYLVQHGMLEENIAANIDSPSFRSGLPKYLTVDESLSLLDTVRLDKDSKNRERDYAILTLFLNCGLRLSELVGINLSNMDEELRSMRVIGKGSKERIVYLNDACREAIADYLKVRPKEIKPGERDALFLSSRGQRISHKTVQWLVKKHLSSSGLGYKQYSTHKLRHTAATLMYQSGKVDVRVLKDILGHEQLNTTQIYTHISDESMEKAMDANPLAKVKRKKSNPDDTSGEA